MAAAVRIAPSILSADLGRLADEIQEVEAAGADLIHVDVMDGRFVPNITFGPVIVSALRKLTRLPIDVHLMIVEPERYVAEFVAAGADILSVHAEATLHVQRTLAEIRRLGARAGLVLNPHSSEHALQYLLSDLDMVLVMTVNPGFAGQAFLPQVVPKVKAVRALIDASGQAIDLEVDGGVSKKTVKSVVSAGANVLVAGAAVFGRPDRGAALREIREAAAT